MKRKIKVSRATRRLISLWNVNPHCHWCGVLTVLQEYKLKRIKKDHLPNRATRDHLRSRWNSARSEPNYNCEQRIVLACSMCNERRGAQEEAQQPIEVLWERSRQHKK